MNLQVSDTGSFWLDPMSKLASKFNSITADVTEKDKTKAQLFVDLCSSGADTTSRRFLKKELVEMCIDR